MKIIQKIHLTMSTSFCTESSEIDDKMDRVEVIDLCSESKTKDGE